MERQELEEIYSPSEMDKESSINFGVGKIPTSLAPIPLFFFIGGVVVYFTFASAFGVIAGLIISMTPCALCLLTLKMFFIGKPAHYHTDSLAQYKGAKPVLSRKKNINANPLIDLNDE